MKLKVDKGTGDGVNSLPTLKVRYKGRTLTLAYKTKEDRDLMAKSLSAIANYFGGK